MPDPVTVKAATDAINYASMQSDRWLFIALLVVFLIAVWLMARYFTKRDETTRGEVIAMQGRLDEQMKAFNAFLIERNTAMTAVIEKNNDLLQSAVHALESSAEVMRAATSSIERRVH